MFNPFQGMRLEPKTTPGATVRLIKNTTIDLGGPGEPVKLSAGIFGRVVRPVHGGAIVFWATRPTEKDFFRGEERGVASHCFELIAPAEYNRESEEYQRVIDRG